MFHVSFRKFDTARSGNYIFQYLTCKLIELIKGHTYVELEKLDMSNIFRVTEDNIDAFIANSDIPTSNIYVEGFFQKSKHFMNYRKQLLDILYESNDFWYFNGKPTYIRDFLYSKHQYTFQPNDIVMSLRLDDFIQCPCPTSDILPPQFYLDILESRFVEKLYIVCDTIRHDWERRYLEFFEKWNPIMIQGDLFSDCAVMREAPVLIHSNSTLSWIMSFFSREHKLRFIPKTNFYKGQCLQSIENTDTIMQVAPLPHNDVYSLSLSSRRIHNFFPLPYSIPDEYIVATLPEKTETIASFIPGATGDCSANIYNKENEHEYDAMYQKARFAHTKKKGGWDCLRHYEILANGCIPIYANPNYPTQSLVSFPKQECEEASKRFLPWKNEYTEAYSDYAKNILTHTRNTCSTSATVRCILSKLKNADTMKNVLMISCHMGVNYLRDFTWIGMKRHIESIGGEATEYPVISYLYDDYPKHEMNSLHGKGFKYAGKLEHASKHSYSSDEIKESIVQKKWDLVIFGKIGPDELFEGTMPNIPFWDHVIQNYSKDKVIFLYGGDEQFNLTHENRYSNHLLHHSQYGKCFIREIYTKPAITKPSLRIGVAIPTYINHLSVLERCLDSIEAQTRKPSIVSISCSSSKDSVALKSYSFPIRIQYIEDQQNAAQNRNSAANSIVDEVDIIAFIDSDDEMYPRYIEFVERAFIETSCDFIVHSFVALHSPNDPAVPEINEYYAHEHVLMANPDPYGGVILKKGIDALKHREIANGHVSVRSEIFKKEKIGLNFPLWEDSEYNKRLINCGYKGVYIPTQLSRVHSYK